MIDKHFIIRESFILTMFEILEVLLFQYIEIGDINEIFFISLPNLWFEII